MLIAFGLVCLVSPALAMKEKIDRVECPNMKLRKATKSNGELIDLYKELDLQDDASIQEIRRSIPGSSNFLY
jgi:hypothetical protein